MFLAVSTVTTAVISAREGAFQTDLLLPIKPDGFDKTVAHATLGDVRSSCFFARAVSVARLAITGADPTTETVCTVGHIAATLPRVLAHLELMRVRWDSQLVVLLRLTSDLEVGVHNLLDWDLAQDL